MEVLIDDLEHLRVQIEVSLGTGVRKHTELLKLKIENVNFSGLSVFRPAKRARCRSKTKLVSFGGHEGQASAPSFDSDEWSSARSFAKVIDSRTTGNVFDYKQ